MENNKGLLMVKEMEKEKWNIVTVKYKMVSGKMIKSIIKE